MDPTDRKKIRIILTRCQMSSNIHPGFSWGIRVCPNAVNPKIPKEDNDDCNSEGEIPAKNGIID
jgi:hypothetical protein